MAAVLPCETTNEHHLVYALTQQNIVSHIHAAPSSLWSLIARFHVDTVTTMCVASVLSTGLTQWLLTLSRNVVHEIAIYHTCLHLRYAYS